MKHITILGANGHLGNEALHAFHAGGYRVTAVTRNGHVRKAPDDVKCIAVNALNLRQLKKAVRGADFVFNGLSPAYTDWTHAALPMARHVIDAVRSTGAVHLFPSNVCNYGKQIPEWCDANTPMLAQGMKGKIRLEMEKLFAIAAQKYRIQTLILRSGDFYGGSGTGSWFDLALVDKLDNGQFVYPGPLDVPHAWAYLPDLAGTFVMLAERHQQCTDFETILYPGHSLTGAGLKVLLEQVCGRELKLVGMPWNLIKFGGVLVPMWREMAETSYLWQRPHRLCGGRLTQLVGELEQTSADVAIRQALQDLGKI